MQEQSSKFCLRMLAGLLPAAVLLLFGFSAHAGDPIQFSTDKSKPAPAQAPQVEPQLFKTWNKSKTPAPPNVLTPYINRGGSFDPREERRLRIERDEKKNWMLLEPGELQKREEEQENQFGGRTVAIDELDGDEEGNYLFYNNQAKSEKPRNNARDIDAEESEKAARAAPSIFAPRETEKPGAHTSSELNLKNLIDPAQIDPAKINKNEASLFQFLKDASPPPPDRDQQARRESFRDFINGPHDAAPSGVSDPINFRGDLTQERMNPIMPRSALDLPATKSSESFSAKPPSFGSGFTPSRPSLPDMVSTAPRRVTPGSSLPSPLMVPNEAPKTPRTSLFNREAPALRR